MMDLTMRQPIPQRLDSHGTVADLATQIGNLVTHLILPHKKTDRIYAIATSKRIEKKKHKFTSTLVEFGFTFSFCGGCKKDAEI